MIGPMLCLRCARARANGQRSGDRCLDRDGGGPYAYLRDWRCDCGCARPAVAAR